MNEKITRLQAIQNNITRYEGMLKSKLSSTELRFVEKRLSEERFALAMAQFMGPSNSPEMIKFPDALQQRRAFSEPFRGVRDISASANFASQSFRNGSMFEIVVAVIAVVSISFFLVHAVEAYLTNQEAAREPRTKVPRLGIPDIDALLKPFSQSHEVIRKHTWAQPHWHDQRWGSVMWVFIENLYREYCLARLQEMRKYELSH